MKKIALVLLLGVLMSLNLSALQSGQKDVDPVGSWVFDAPDAPYGYNAGEIVVAKEKDAFTVQLKFGEYGIKAYNIKYEKNILSFTVYVESEAVMVKADFSKEKVTGKATTSEGDIPFTATRKKVEKK